MVCKNVASDNHIFEALPGIRSGTRFVCPCSRVWRYTVRTCSGFHLDGFFCQFDAYAVCWFRTCFRTCAGCQEDSSFDSDVADRARAG